MLNGECFHDVELFFSIFHVKFKLRRGVIMGVWNWHSSVGNLLGNVIPAFWATPGTW